MSRRALRAAASADARQERPGEHGWLEWLRARLDPAWRAGEWDGEALLFTGDLAVGADSGVAVPHAWMPDGDAPPVGTLRRLPPRPGKRGPALGGVRLRAAAAGDPAAAPRPLRGARLRRRSALRRVVLPARALLGQGQERAGRGVHRPGPAAGPGRGMPGRWLRPREHHPAAGCAASTTSGCTASAVLLTGDELAAWVASERPRLGVHQFSLAGLPELLRDRVALRAAAA